MEDFQVNEKMLKSYSKGDKLGNGANGVVYSATKDNTRYALKEINDTDDDGDDITEAIKLEYNILLKLKNLKGVLNIENGFKSNDKIILITEIIDGIDLETLIYSNQKISGEHIKWIIAQLLCALKLIHEKGIVHMDLKPGNVMISSASDIKIIDFGSSLFVDDEKQGTLTTPNYLNKNYDYKNYDQLIDEKQYYLDIWCVGCIMYELYEREFLFNSITPAEHQQLLHEFDNTENRKIIDDDDGTANKFFNYIMNSNEPPLMDDILGHEWIKGNVEKINKIPT